MKITAIEALRYTPPPLPPALETARRPSWHGRQDVSHPLARYRGRRVDFNALMPWGDLWVRVQAENGMSGLGATQFAGPVAALVREHLGPALVGEDCLATDRLADLMFRLTKPYGSAGIASWRGERDRPRALGPSRTHRGRTRVPPPRRSAAPRPCYATTNDVDWAMELGFEAVKVTLAYGPEAGSEGLDRNEAFIAECRETIGDERELFIDCWMSLDVDYTVRLSERLWPYQPGWLEECLLPEDFDGHVALRRRLPVQTLATGEHWYSHFPFQWAAARRVVDVLQPDIQWCGGLSALTRIAAIADSAGLATMPHLAGSTAFGQHASVGIATIHRVEYRIGSDPGIPLDRVAQAPGAVLPVEGEIGASDAPGFGIDIPAEQLSPF